jgi:hypothetical protein
MTEEDINTSGSIGSLEKMPRHQRYYMLHRDQKLNKLKEQYNNNPEVIARREERLRKKAEKDAQTEAKRIEKERIRQEKLALAEATSQRKKTQGGGLDCILDGNCPA